MQTLNFMRRLFASLVLVAGLAGAAAAQTMPDANAPQPPADAPELPVVPVIEPGTDVPATPPSAPPGENPPADTPPATEPPSPPEEPPAEPDHPGEHVPGDELLNERPTFLANVEVNKPDGRYLEGEKLAVRFNVERRSHVYLFYHQADRSCVMLFPNKVHRDNVVEPQQVVTIPAPGEPFRFRVRAPFGEEALQVLAALEPIETLDELGGEAETAVPIAPEVLASLQAEIKARPEQYGEHRVRIVTVEGDRLPPARAAARVGLFVGANRYKNEEYGKPTDEFRRSAEFMAKLFVSRCGLDPERTRLLVQEEATRVNFEESLVNWLPAVTQPGDTVFIYYVGHGGQVKNLDGTEPDGLDEYLTFYDTDPWSEAEGDWDARVRRQAVLDDTLARWLQELPGRQIVLILDTCHGGGAVDARSFARSFRAESQRVRDVSRLNTIVICGCLPDEVVWFGGGKDRMTYIPYMFYEAVEKLPRPVTIAQAFDYYRRELEPRMREEIDVWYAQEPNITDTALLPVYLVP